MGYFEKHMVEILGARNRLLGSEGKALKLLIEIEAYEIKNIEWLRRNKLSHVSIVDLFIKMSSGWDLNGKPCSDCGTALLFFKESIWCPYCKKE